MTAPLTASWALKRSFPSVRLRSWRVSWRQGAMRPVGAFMKISHFFKIVPKRVYRFTQPQNEWPASFPRPKIALSICRSGWPQIGCPTSSRVKPSQTEASQAEPIRAEPTRAGPFRAELIQADRVDASRSNRTDRSRTDRLAAEPALRVVLS